MRPCVLPAITGVGNGPWVPLDQYQNPASVSIQVKVVGTVTYSVVWTEDDPFNIANPLASAGPTMLTGATTTQVGSLVNTAKAVQLQVTAGSGSAQMTVNQSGVMG